MTWPPEKPDATLAAIAARQHAVRRGNAVVKKLREYPEEAEQKRLVEELRWRVIPPARFWAVPNQRGTRKAWENQLLVSLGLEAGVSDLHFAWHGTGGRGLARPQFGVIEMKAPGKGMTTTPEQDAFILDMERIGHKAAVCDSALHALEVLAIWGFPLKAVR